MPDVSTASIFPIQITTQRLLLRLWKDSDYAPFATMSANAEVMKFLASSTLTRQDSDNFVDQQKTFFDEYGWGLWAIEVPGIHPFVGFAGLHKPSYPLPFSLPSNPCTALSWRLDQPYWGHGYATEAAQAVIACAFNQLAIQEVVAFTALQNPQSIAVMKRLGMQTHPADNFDFPLLEKSHPLTPHVLYRIASGNNKNSATIYS
ncbi:MAG: GNAT family N-acetyltransferase [Pseudomonadota bacterium]